MDESFDVAKAYAKNLTLSEPKPVPIKITFLLAEIVIRLFLGLVLTLVSFIIVIRLGPRLIPSHPVGGDAMSMGMGLVLGPFYVLTLVVIACASLIIAFVPKTKVKIGFLLYGLFLLLTTPLFGYILYLICKPRYT